MKTLQEVSENLAGSFKKPQKDVYKTPKVKKNRALDYLIIKKSFQNELKGFL
ncbi:MAG: hypothetical protein WBA61_15435 [Aequorivita sp.]